MHDDYRHQQLIAYIEQHLHHETPIETIYANLVDAGWDPATIDQALERVLAGTVGEPPHQPMEQARAYAPQTEDTIPAKYGLFAAIGETLRAAQNNVPGVATAVVLNIAAGIVSFIASFLVLAFLIASLFSYSSTASILIFAIAAMVAGLVWYISVYGFVNMLLAKALYQGINAKPVPVAQLLWQSLRSAPRVLAANILFGLYTVGPLFAGSLLATAFGTVSPGLLFIGFPVMLAGMVWAIIALLRYSLMPYVALFEPSIRVKDTASRSKHLLMHGGQGVLFKGALLLLAVYVVLSVPGTGLTENSAEQGIVAVALSNIVSIILYAVLSVLQIGVLVMLYRNRHAVRDSPAPADTFQQPQALTVPR